MFSRNQNKTVANTDAVSIIAAGMQIIGDIESEGDIRIDGSISGNVFCKAKVVIISSGKVAGDIQAVNIDVHGTVRGNITARDLLSLKANCKIDGNLITERLQIEPNATFNGHCTMTFESQEIPAQANQESVLQEH